MPRHRPEGALIVNYDGFTLDPAVTDAYFSMITYMESRYYASASRYTTSAFMRLKLGAGLQRDLGRTSSRPRPKRTPPTRETKQADRFARLFLSGRFERLGARYPEKGA